MERSFYATSAFILQCLSLRKTPFKLFKRLFSTLPFFDEKLD